jgi:hypothetical protein
MFLEAVGDHPWAGLPLIQAYGGLRVWEIDDVAHPLAEKKYGLVEQAQVSTPSGRVPPRRFGLTPAGAAAIGRRFSRPFMGHALLSALKLDSGRQLLTESVGEAQSMVWSLSPFSVPVKDLRPYKPALKQNRREVEADYAYRNLCLDALACLKFAEGAYLNVALLVDPEGIKLDWFFHQFRSFDAWARRPEFRECLRAVPLLIVVAANDQSRALLVRLWQEAAAWGMSPKRLRVTSLRALAQRPGERQWWDEHGRMTSLWGGLITFEMPCRKPEHPFGGWWGQQARDDKDAHSPKAANRRRVRKPGVVHWANTFQSRPGRKPTQEDVLAELIRAHLQLKAREREFLAEVGRYPLIRQGELSTILGRGPDDVSHGFATLEELGLVEQVGWGTGLGTGQAQNGSDQAGKPGYVLTWRGVALLAAQASFFDPVEYARLMNWPVKEENGQPRYSVDAWLASAEHNRLVLEFLVGLRRNEQSRRLRVYRWDHLNCRQGIPSEKPLPKARGWRLLYQTWISPDASGMVRAFGETDGHYVDTTFWLEVDRRGQRGTELWKKLSRYYQKGGARGGWVGQTPRLLIMVDREDEARLQALRRRLQVLNERYHFRLDVRLSRLDLLLDERGQLDPTRRAWRTLESSEFVEAFDRWSPARKP